MKLESKIRHSLLVTIADSLLEIGLLAQKSSGARALLISVERQG